MDTWLIIVIRRSIFFFSLCLLLCIEANAAASNPYFSSNAPVPNYTTKGYILYLSANALNGNSKAGDDPNYISETPTTDKCPAGWNACISAWIVNTNRLHTCAFNQLQMNTNISASGIPLTPYSISIDASVRTIGNGGSGTECDNRAIKANYMISCMPPNSTPSNVNSSGTICVAN